MEGWEEGRDGVAGGVARVRREWDMGGGREGFRPDCVIS